MIEYRKHERKNIEFEGFLVVGADCLLGKTTNASSGGVCFEIRDFNFNRFEKDSTGHLFVNLPKSDTLYSFYVRFPWINDHSVGLEFINITSIDKEIQEEFSDLLKYE